VVYAFGWVKSITVKGGSRIEDGREGKRRSPQAGDRVLELDPGFDCPG
jgi:hypothetical protein